MKHLSNFSITPALFSLLFLSSFFGLGQDSMESSVLDLNNNDSFESFSMLDETIEENTVFFTGEDHRYRSSNNELEYKMFKYFHEKGNCNTLLLESGYSRGWLITKWLESQDSSWYQVLKNYSFKVDLEKLQRYYDYYQEQEDDKKFEVVGIDIERGYPLTLKVLSLLLPPQPAPGNISLEISALKSMARYLDEQRMDDDNFIGYLGQNQYSERIALDSLIKNFGRHKTDYEEYLGDNYQPFEEILTSAKISRKWNAYNLKKIPHHHIIREEAILENFKIQLDKKPNEQFFGQFGRCHVANKSQKEACGWYEYNSIAKLIGDMNDPRVQNRVLSIAIFYDMDFDLPDFAGSSQIEDFQENAEKGAQTIYAINDSLEKDSVTVDNLHLSDYYDYLIVNKENIQGQFDDDEDIYGSNSGYSSSHNYFDFGWELAQFDLTSLNTFLDSNGMPSLNGNNNAIRIAFGAQEDGGFGSGTVIGVFLPQNKDYNDSSRLAFTNWLVGLRFNYDLIPNTPNFTLAPMVEIDFMLSKIRQYDNFENGNVSFLKKSNFLEVTNPSVQINPGLEMRLALGSFTLDLWGTHRFDLSKQIWKQEQQAIDDSPNTTFSGFSFGASIGFYTSYF